MKVYTKEDIEKLEKHFRIHLINMASGVRAGNLIGTIGQNGVSNLAVFNSVMHIGANPALMAFILRPLTVERHTYENIVDRNFFTINHIHEDIHENAHLTSAKFGKEVSEFDACDIEPYFHENFPAPFVKKSPVKIGLTFEESCSIKANNTLLLVGRVEMLIIDEEILHPDGHIDLEKARSVGIGGLDTYYSVQKLGSYAYAKPGEKIKKL
jgi:flavin reductase (DIM6/NTAB) family NADH-FMN oxidoreductase RutF